MTKEKETVLMKELRELPKPKMAKSIQDQMLLNIESFSAKHVKRKRWAHSMKKVYASVASTAAVAVLAVTFFTYNNEVVEDSNVSHQTASPKDLQTIDPVDIDLPEHQVAIEDIYFGIPFKKKDVFIDRRIEGEYTLVDIRDKQTNELLYRFGETKMNGTEKMVFREVFGKKIKTAIRLQIFVEVDKKNRLITKVQDSNITYAPQPEMIDDEFILAFSRTDKFPAEKVEVLGRIQLAEKVESEDPAKNLVIENFYEGFEIGVIKED